MNLGKISYIPIMKNMYFQFEHIFPFVDNDFCFRFPQPLTEGWVCEAENSGPLLCAEADSLSAHRSSSGTNGGARYVNTQVTYLALGNESALTPIHRQYRHLIISLCYTRYINKEIAPFFHLYFLQGQIISIWRTWGDIININLSSLYLRFTIFIFSWKMGQQ